MNRYRVASLLWSLVTLVLPADGVVHAEQVDRIDLAGTWDLRLDPAYRTELLSDTGTNYPNQITLPGTVAGSGWGEIPGMTTEWVGSIREEVWKDARYAPYQKDGNFKIPFWLQPQRKYTGPVWFRRQVTVPAEWAGKRIVLRLERVHWLSTVSVDGVEVGSQNSLSTPHEFDLSEQLTPGKHTLVVCVDNRVQLGVGQDAHSVSDHTQTNWNGIIGAIELVATDPVWLDDVQIFPDNDHKAIRVQVTVGNRTGQAGRAKLTVGVVPSAFKGPAIARQEIALELADDAATHHEVVYPLGDNPNVWDEFNPRLYELRVSLDAESTQHCRSERRVRFGLREIRLDGHKFLVNGQQTMFRGTLECCIFPLTGYPPTEVEPWKRIIRICQSYGLNHMRFHSYCPPEAAFQAADELGFYFQVEGPFWCGLGGNPDLGKFVYDEHERIRRVYGNHPSFMLLAYGNEPGGEGSGGVFLAPWVEKQKAADQRHLVTAASGWPQIPESQYHIMPQPLRLQGKLNTRVPSTQFDYRDTVAKFPVPIVSHESGQWCVFPDLSEIDRYTGNLRAKNFEIVRDFLEGHGLLHQAHDFLIASGKLQALCYKQEIEAFLRTPDFGGFQLLDLHDFPGQGTALVGVLNAFWEEKGYLTASEHRRYCGPVVPLARMEKFVWTNDETFTASVEVSQFGADDWKAARVTWRLTDPQHKILAQGEFPKVDLPCGKLTQVGQVSFPLSDLKKPTWVKLEVQVGPGVANDWTIWVYPQQMDTEAPQRVLVAESLDEAVVAQLKAGGRVLLLIPPERVAADTYGSFGPIFWNRLWFPDQAEHTLGLLCDPQHPALAEFPTFSHSHWQWWDPCVRSKPLVLDSLPRKLQPIVQPIDDWNTCRKLATVFEAQVLGGKLLVASIDLKTDLASRPVARQLRSSLLHYADSEAFQPQVEVEVDQIRNLYRHEGD